MRGHLSLDRMIVLSRRTVELSAKSNVWFGLAPANYQKRPMTRLPPPQWKQITCVHDTQRAACNQIRKKPEIHRSPASRPLVLAVWQGLPEAGRGQPKCITQAVTLRECLHDRVDLCCCESVTLWFFTPFLPSDPFGNYEGVFAIGHMTTLRHGSAKGSAVSGIEYAANMPRSEKRTRQTSGQHIYATRTRSMMQFSGRWMSARLSSVSRSLTYPQSKGWHTILP